MAETHLEKMGNELKCPICLSLFDSAFSIPCNHVFCDLCIKKSMKSASSCPVCKIPFHRREIRAAPHMDNLVSIFKSMECANAGSKKNTEGANISCANSSEEKKILSPKRKNKPISKTKPSLPKSLSNPKPNPISNPKTNPSFPTKKRVHVTPFPLNETPIRPEKVSKLEKGQSEKLAADLRKGPSLSPFFCLRDDEVEEENEENEYFESLSSDWTPSKNVPCFSDIKDSDDDDDVILNTTPNSKVKASQNFERENVECTQRPCSRVLYSTPLKMSKGKEKVDQIQEEKTSPNDEISPVNNEERKLENKRKRNSKISPSVSNKRISKKSEENNKNSIDKEKVGDVDYNPKVSKRKNHKKNLEKASNCKTIVISTQKKVGEIDKLPGLKKSKNKKDNNEKITNSNSGEEKDINNNEKEGKIREKTPKMKKINECDSSNFNLKKCENILSKVVCAFCHSADVNEVSGEIVHYLEGKPVNADFTGDGHVVHSHKNCLEWAPDVYFEDDVAVNLSAELARSKRIKCCCCSIKGAALGCFESTCRKSFHFTCAKLVPQCRWDNENFVMLCPLHQSFKLPVESSQSQKKNKNKSSTKGSSEVLSVKKTENGLSKAWKWASGSPYKWVLSCSALTLEEKELVSEFSRLTGALISKTWSPSITHVIASTDETGACKRTLKYLMAVLTGKWILKLDWIRVCLDAMEPVDEEKFEVKVDVHGIRNGPTLGRLKITNKEPKLFDQMKFFLIGDYTKDYKDFIQNLVMTAGGTILQRKPISRDQEKLLDDSSPIYIIYSVENREKHRKCDERVLLEAKVLADVSGGEIASTAWIIDSIAACKLQPLI